MYWDCPKCAAENSLDATCCWRCGFQNYGSVDGTVPSPDQPQHSTDAIKKQRQGIKEDLKKGVDESLARSRTTLDRLARGNR